MPSIFTSAVGLSAIVLSVSACGKTPDVKTAAASAVETYPIGYSDTPVIPGTNWRVHDIDRPRPPAVKSEVVTTPPPSDAIVLFDGKDLSAWQGERGGEASFTVKDGVFTVSRPDKDSGKPGRRENIMTRQSFGDVQLHVEWRAPDNPILNSQRRGNSGVIFMGQYEVQVLDSYENPTYADGQAASLYGWKPPLVNATSPTREWQSYDIIFEAPRRDMSGDLMKKARVTVLHNGVLMHHAQDYLGKSSHKAVAQYEVHPDKAPIKIQDHGDAVSFRNIWVRELDLSANK